MKVSRAFFRILAFAMFVASLPAFGQADWELKKSLHIGEVGGWDYLTVDSRSHLLYVPRSTHTIVINSEDGKIVADIPGQKRAHGVQ